MVLQIAQILQNREKLFEDFHQIFEEEKKKIYNFKS